MSQLYALLDINTLSKHNKNIEWFISQIKYFNASILQYRNKSGSMQEKERDLRLIKSFCDLPLIVNDDLSLIHLCDGLHLGQDDILNYGKDIKSASSYVREKIKDKILGLSTHNKEEILISNELAINYIGLGAYRQTDTKSVNTILGNRVEELASYSNKDVAVIGGVKLSDKFSNIKYKVIGSNLYEN